ncbi:MAG: M23 family metallopeptidase [Archangium sp.]|nr:M23 family metallopeptidase [Archangium sp.]MDP3570100.1 M23 family metallopeptidase [Archangium sp.]
MLRGLLFSLLLTGCAITPPPPRISFDEVTRTATPENTGLETSFARFLESARKTRLAATVGAPMPVGQAEAWSVLLDDTEHFVAQKSDAQWTQEAMRARLQLETEFQTDARTFGDVPLALAERVPRILRALSRRITALTTRTRQVDPKRFRWPVSPLIVSSPYGSRIHPIAGETRFHAGIDLEAPLAQPVHAAEVGTVVFSAWNGAHGKQIEVQHDAHWATRYSHLDTLLVRPGTVVKKGQLIGLAGQTGLTTGPHVHFELRRDGDALDPEVFLQLPATGPALISERP